MTFTNTAVEGDSARLHAGGAVLSALSESTDRVVVSVLDASRIDWSGEAESARRAVLEVGVGLLHRVHDSVAEVSRACAELARAVEDTRERIEEAERATPVWPTAPEPLPAVAEPVDQWIHEQATQRYLDDVAAYHRLCDRLQSVIDDAQDDLVAARHRFAAACEVATNHLLAPPSGPQWTWDRDMMARANTDLADAFATGDVQLINSHAQIAGSSYAMSTLTRGLWNAVTGTVETAADAVTGAANAVWDAFESIGTGFGLGRPVDPEPHFEGIDITVDPAYPLDPTNQAITIAAELAWGVVLAGGMRAAVRPWAGSVSSGLADDVLRLDANAVARLSVSERRAVRSLQARIVEHEAKLAAYVADPYAFDNLGYLANAPSDAVRASIIAGRVRHLENEMSAFAEQIRRIVNSG